MTQLIVDDGENEIGGIHPWDGDWIVGETCETRFDGSGDSNVFLCSGTWLTHLIGTPMCVVNGELNENGLDMNELELEVCCDFQQ